LESPLRCFFENIKIPLGNSGKTGGKDPGAAGEENRAREDPGNLLFHPAPSFPMFFRISSGI